MLNPYEHEDADALTGSVRQIIEPVAALIARARDEEVEVVYVNDNHGDWSASPADLAERAMEGARPDLVEPILPPDDASFVLKARHTIFHGTPLEYLLFEKEVGETCSWVRSPSSASPTARSMPTCVT